jgi:hypothetical protein
MRLLEYLVKASTLAFGAAAVAEAAAMMVALLPHSLPPSCCLVGTVMKLAWWLGLDAIIYWLMEEYFEGKS